MRMPNDANKEPHKEGRWERGRQGSEQVCNMYMQSWEAGQHLEAPGKGGVG